MAESIGEAYVKVTSRGENIGAKIRDELDSANPSIRKSGRDAGKSYADEFDSEVRKSYKGKFGRTQKEMTESLNKSLTDSLARMELAERFFNSPGWKKFQRRLGNEGGVAGDLFAKRLAERLKDSGNLEQLGNSMRSIGPELRKIQREILTDLHTEALAMNKQHNRQQAALLTEAYRLNREYDRRSVAAAKLLANEQGQLRTEYQRLEISIQRLLSGERDLNINRREAIDLLDQHASAARRLQIYDEDFDARVRRQSKALREFNPGLQQTARSVDLYSDRLGRAFGRGSRNDVLNAFGGIVRLGARLPLVFTSIAGKASNMLRVVSEAPGILGKFAAAGGQLGGALLKTGPALIGIIGALTFIIGPLVASLSLLVGVLTALGSSVIMGAIGALGALAGAALPAVVGIGVLVAAIRNAPKETKAAFTGLKQEFSVLGDIAGRTVFKNGAAQVGAIRDVVRSLRPIVRDIGLEISGVGDYFADLTRSSGFKSFRDEMAVFLPQAVGKLGRSFVNALGGVGGLLRGLVPLTDRFLNWLERSTRKFSEFANSVEGQNKLKDFFDRAGDSASSLGGLLGSVSSLLGTILAPGARSGDSLIDSLSASVDKFNRFLKDNPGALSDWFADAEEFGRNLGSTIESVGRIVDELDNSLSRANANSGLKAIGDSFRFIADGAAAIGKIDSALGKLDASIHRVQTITRNNLRASFYDMAAGGVSAFASLANAAFAAFDTILGAAEASLGWIPGYGDKLGTARQMLDVYRGAVVGNLEDISAGLSGSADELRAFSDRIAAVAGKGQKIQVAVDELGLTPTLGKLRDLAGEMKLNRRQIKIIAEASGIELTKEQMEELLRVSGKVDALSPKLDVSAETQSALAALGNVLNRGSQVDQQRPKPVATLTDRVSAALVAISRDLQTTGRRRATPSASLDKGPFDGALRTVNSALTNVDGRNARPKVRADTGNSLNLIQNVGQAVANLRDKTVTVRVNQVGGLRAVARGAILMASGGVLNSETMIRPNVRAGESGREAVVPLERPLGQVDPSVRLLSAIAQGKVAVGGGGGRRIDIAQLNFTSNATDPQVAARELLDQLINRF